MKTLWRLPITLVLAVYFADAAVAANCDQPENNIEMIQCGDYEYSKADAALLVAYKRSMTAAKKFDGSGAISLKLRDAQRAWIKFRDADCDANASPYQGGSVQPVVKNSCMLSHVQERTKQLESFSTILEQ